MFSNYQKGTSNTDPISLINKSVMISILITIWAAAQANHEGALQSTLAPSPNDSTPLKISGILFCSAAYAEWDMCFRSLINGIIIWYFISLVLIDTIILIKKHNLERILLLTANTSSKQLSQLEKVFDLTSSFQLWIILLLSPQHRAYYHEIDWRMMQPFYRKWLCLGQQWLSYLSLGLSWMQCSITSFTATSSTLSRLSGFTPYNQNGYKKSWLGLGGRRSCYMRRWW